MSTQAEFAATLVDEWALSGVRDAVLCPGSRSAPLAIALLSDGRIAVHVRLDERSAGFFAIGCAVATGRPVLVVVTSGTAASELHAAVLEADLGGVPIVVCTADRPASLHSVGAPQTVDQQRLFGTAVRFYAEPGVATDADRGAWRSLASRLVRESVDGPRGPGPVHANIAFVEPLTGAAEHVPAGRPGDRAPWHSVVRGPSASDEAVGELVGIARRRKRGVLLAGAGAAGATGGRGARAVVELARALRWPVIADLRSWPRTPDPVVVASGDGIARAAEALGELRPDVVVHLGSPHASKVLARWGAASADLGTEHVLVDAFGRFEDPERLAATVLGADPGVLATRALERVVEERVVGEPGWMERWRGADDAAQGAIDAVLARQRSLTEPGVARAVFRSLPDGATLVSSSSMPVRDLEWFAAPRPGAPRVLANRGANGIDGVVSTVLGAAASREAGDGPVVGLLGDLAFFHDLSGLVWGAAERVPDATLVVVDNSGGGIFEFLAYPSVLDPASYERAFATPQRSDVGEVARALGCSVASVDSADALAAALEPAGGGVRVVHVRTERSANVALHGELERAIVAAVGAALGTPGGSSAGQSPERTSGPS
ncbi:MAG: 2-succinyl-5-enolpyruvyl-6-hydroxy-3-cyclohexene-1-carboxylic-acid synthase [Actinomycetota bacterium]|nr:2-succinyl-5-enolpyruvyl-6-hydroxy-3-cyclohexene-1-carboxylic-acid synthase [Actinomycetota bacterium]